MSGQMEGSKIANALACAEDIFVEVSHGPTLIDNNLLLSECACRLCTQGIALVHNLIAGSFTWVGIGTDNGGKRFPTPRYTPYHVPHRTEIAGFMTILHGDARFYNNIFVQKKIRQDMVQWLREDQEDGLAGLQFVCGTKPYDGYPSAETYFAQFNEETVVKRREKDMYYDHLPVYTGGNVYFNGAQPYDGEENCKVDAEHEITLQLLKEGNSYKLQTNLYEYLPEFEIPVVSTAMLGEAFEPEQRFEAPDGSPIEFNRDYFGKVRAVLPLSGPFACGCEAEESLV